MRFLAAEYECYVCWNSITIILETGKIDKEGFENHAKDQELSCFICGEDEDGEKSSMVFHTTLYRWEN